MKSRPLRLLLWIGVLWVAGTGCRTEFERARMSQDPELILEKALEYYEDEDYLKAQTLFELILNQYRGRPEAEEMFYKYAYTFYYLNQYSLAAQYFQNFSATFLYSPNKEESDFMIGYSYYQISPIFRLDQQPSKDAIQAFQEFVNQHPTSDRVDECNRLINELRAKLEQKAYSAGQMYFDQNKYLAAITTFEDMLRSYPESDRVELVELKILQASYDYAVNSIFERRQARYEDAIEQYEEFIGKYPNSKYREDAEKIYNKALEALRSLTQ